jgi:hypothetical protein
MVIVFIIGPGHVEEGPSGDKLKDEAAEVLDVKGFH